MKEIDLPNKSLDERVVPKWIGRPLGITAFSWAVDINRGERPITVNRLAAGMGMGAVEYLLPTLGRGVFRSGIEGAEWTKKRDGGEDRFIGGFMFDVAIIISSLVIYSNTYNATYDIGHALGVAGATKVMFNSIPHFIGDLMKSDKKS